MKDILIVEDGRQERNRLEKLFSQAGYSIVACESVSSAEQALEREMVRLAILDIGLGDKSGSLLFNRLKQSKKAPFIIIFTGNPSVHLKQRFLDEGAADYIVKASAAAGNESFLSRIQDLLGESSGETVTGVSLNEFVGFLDEKSRKLFLDVDNNFPACSSCGSRSYKVIFAHTTQMPPDISGKVVCVECSQEMDPEIT